MSRRPSSLQTPARPPVARKDDWLPRLEQAIARARELPFVWGSHDCCLFPCDVVRAMTGVDPARGLRGHYRSFRRAMVVLHGFGGMEALAEKIAARYGIPEVAPGLARRGDVVLLDARAPAGGARLELGPGGPCCLAIVGLAGTEALAAAPAGLLEVPMPFWRRAWRIG